MSDDEQDIDSLSVYDSVSDTESIASESDVVTKQSKHTEIVSVNETYDRYNNTTKITKPILTRFEKAKLLGVRSEMLASGSPALIHIPPGVTSVYEIAKLEFKQKKIPLIIKRTLPNNTCEYWRLEDLVFL